MPSSGCSPACWSRPASRTIVQSNERLLEFAQGSFFLLMIVQLGIVIGITAAIKRISATAALALFFVYAASLGVTIGLIVSAYTTASVATAFVGASAMFGAAAVYGAVTKRELPGIGGYPVHRADRDPRRVPDQHLPREQRPDLGHLDRRGRPLHGPDRLRRPADQGRQPRGGDRVDGEGGRHGRPSLYLDFVNLFLFMLRLMGGRN